MKQTLDQNLSDATSFIRKAKGYQAKGENSKMIPFINMHYQRANYYASLAMYEQNKVIIKLLKEIKE